MRKIQWFRQSSETGNSSFPWKYVFTLFLTLIFTLVDGTLTIFLVRRGAWEANPVMRHALSISFEYFLALKYLLTAGGLFVLLRLGRRKLFGGALTAEELAAGIVLFYEGLIIYEVTIYHIVK
jgi:hypothetical protein